MSITMKPITATVSIEEGTESIIQYVDALLNMDTNLSELNLDDSDRDLSMSRVEFERSN